MAELQGQVARLGLQDAVHFIGEVADARELMCAADIYLLSSNHEGMPNVILEAMAAGVPSVATPVNSIETLIQHGATGFIAAPIVDELAVQVARLAADPDLRLAMGARARVAVEEAYQPEQVVRRLWALCD
ncbi:MAG: glycosyltransferase [Gammaproteobacteria bacterium]